MTSAAGGRVSEGAGLAGDGHWGLDTRSLWMDTGPATDFPALDSDLDVEVAVIGGGIAGLSVALALQREGVKVAVIDAGRVGRGVTARSTAKITSLHGLIYATLESDFGEEGARIYGEANEAGMRSIAETAEELGIDCDLRWLANFTYADSGRDRDRIEQEVEAASRAGLPASYVEEVPLPFEVEAAVRFDRQAEFHPVKYVVGLARWLDEQGCRIFEETPVRGVEDGEPVRVETSRGTVRADHAVVATNFPFLDRGLFFARMHAERSYAIAVPLQVEPPAGMFMSAGQPTRSIRFHSGDGRTFVLVGGEGHKVGQGGATAPRYQALEDYARERFSAGSPEYRWSTQDNLPIDGVPFVGRVTPRSKRVYTVTGFKKWGIAHAPAAAMMLRDQILGRDNDWLSLYDSNRFTPRQSVKDFVKENLNVAFHFFADRLARRSGDTASNLGPGEGQVVSRHGRQIGVSRSSEGEVIAVSARCTHMGCIVEWNDAEGSWDCPCHGSRFSATGAVIHGPAIDPLKETTPPSD